MVIDKQNIVENALEDKNFLLQLSVEEMNEIIEEFPAFNGAYLFKSFMLFKSDEVKFQNELPFIATQVNDRTKLHDYIYQYQKPIVSKQKEKQENIVAQDAIKEEVQEVEDIKLTEVSKEKESKDLVKIEEAKSNKDVYEIETEKVEDKEQRRREAMRKLQEELFADKLKKSNASDKDDKRINAMQKLQDELFSDKVADTKPEVEAAEEVVTEKVEKENEPVDFEFSSNENAEVKQEQNQKLDEFQINENKAKQEIEELIKQQEQVVEKIVSEENQFKPKTEKLEFIDWLKLKNVSNSTNVSSKQPTKKEEDTSIVDKENEHQIPIDPSGRIEAEMHQEIKTSTDPLDHFISAQISKKKRKKTVSNKVKTNGQAKNKNLIVSETLAEILVVQQKYKEAIDVYSLLGLKYPQKSIYFARQIEKIKTYL